MQTLKLPPPNLNNNNVEKHSIIFPRTSSNDNLKHLDVLPSNTIINEKIITDITCHDDNNNITHCSKWSIYYRRLTLLTIIMPILQTKDISSKLMVLIMIIVIAILM